nr:hypothetical protein [Desulfogranum japonicum]
MEFFNLDLAILLSYRLMDSWNGSMRVIAAVEHEEDKEKARKSFSRLVELVRLPADTSSHIADGDFGRYASTAPEADLNISPLPNELDAEFLWSLRDATGLSCLFTQDSGDESALA